MNPDEGGGMPRSRLFSTVGAVCLGAAVIVALAGCTSVPLIETEPVAVEGSLPGAPRVDASSTIISATESLPYLVTGLQTDSASGSALVTWSSADGITWEQRTVVEPAVADFAVDGDATIVAIAYETWREGRAVTELTTSTDRVVWTGVELPAAAQTGTVTGLSVVDGVVYLFVEDDDRVSTAYTVAAGTVAELELPVLDEGARLRPIDVGAIPAGLILIARPGFDGKEQTTASYLRSGDDWRGPYPVGADRTVVSGVIALGDELIATGADAADEGADTLIPTAWSSADGETWSREQLAKPSRGSGFAITDAATAALGAPNTNAADVVAIASNGRSSISAIYRRSPDGRWMVGAGSSENSGNGLGGGAVLSPDGAMIVAIVRGSGFARVATSVGGDWVDRTTLASREYLARPVVDGRGPTPVVATSTPVWSTQDGGWRSGSTEAAMTLSATGLVPAELPALADGQDGALRAADAGATLFFATTYLDAGSTTSLSGWTRADGGDWVPMTGLENTPTPDLLGAERMDGTWYAYGQVRKSLDVGSPSHGRVLTSADGVAWTDEPGEFGALESRTSESVVLDACLVDGDPALVGWRDLDASSTEPMTWVRTDDGWAARPVPALSGLRGRLNACVTSGDRTVLRAELGAENTFLAWRNGEWARTFTTRPGVTIGAPVAIPGGFAAGGSYDREGWDYPAIWLSRDGSSWRPVRVPSHGSGSVNTVASDGDDLLLTMDPWTGDPLSRLVDIARYLP